MKNLARLALLPSLLAAAEGLPHPRGYVAYRASGPITIDGRLNDAAWGNLPWSGDFVDIGLQQSRRRASAPALR